MSPTRRWTRKDAVIPPVARRDLPDGALRVCRLEDDQLFDLAAPPAPLTDEEFYRRLAEAEYYYYGNVRHEPPAPAPEPAPEPISPHGPVIVKHRVPVEEETEEKTEEEPSEAPPDFSHAP